MDTITVTDQFRALRDRWTEVNEGVAAASPGGCQSRGEPLDAARLAELLDLRASLWLALGEAIDRGPADPHTPVYAVACHYAAILDQEDAARTRFAAGLPTLRPRTEVGLLHLDDTRCRACGRPWQLATDGACPSCPRLRNGHPALPPDTWELIDPARLGAYEVEL